MSDSLSLRKLKVMGRRILNKNGFGRNGRRNGDVTLSTEKKRDFG